MGVPLHDAIVTVDDAYRRHGVRDDVTVIAAGESPDQYEANNASAQAYQMPANFSGNFANVVTTGSNLHNNTDVDFYKVVLPGGNNYAIK